MEDESFVGTVATIACGIVATIIGAGVAVWKKFSASGTHENLHLTMTSDQVQILEMIREDIRDLKDDFRSCSRDIHDIRTDFNDRLRHIELHYMRNN